LAAAQSLQAERPAATQLFPKQTLAFVATDDSRELVERFRQTAIGQMAHDPQMKPLVDQIFGAIQQAAQPLEDRFGLSLSELLSIPQGEVAIGLVEVPQMPPALLAVIDTGEQQRLVDKLLERGGATLVESGATHEVEKIGDVDVTIYTMAGGRTRQLIYFEKDGALALGSSLEAIKQLLAVWSGELADSLADNAHFAAISKNVAGTTGEEPQVRWFVDPINAVRALGQQSASAQIGLALLPTLGLDGLLGVGGSMTFAAGQFDAINRAHLLLDNPRAGVVEMIAFGQGEVVPEAWVPSQAANYTTVYWDAGRTYDRLETLVDSFQGEGAFKSQFQKRVLDQADVDIETDILPALAGRFSYVTMVEEPITANSQGQMIGAKLKDPKKFQSVIDRVAEQYRDFTVKKTFGRKSYLQYAPPQLSDEPEADSPQSPRPCFCIVGDYLLIGRESLLQKAIAAEADPARSLAGALEFKLIASKAQKQAGGSRPSLLNFNRPEEGFRLMYGMATSDATRQGLEKGGEQNPFLKNINQALQDNPLPPFAVLQKYLAPGGAVLIDDETGLHYTSFTLRRGNP
jgi:hypothetical protein